MLFLLNYYWTGRGDERKQHREYASLTVSVFGTDCLLTLHQPGDTDGIKPIPVRCKGRDPQGSPALHYHHQKSFLPVKGVPWSLCMEGVPSHRHFQQTIEPLEGWDLLSHLQSNHALCLGPDLDSEPFSIGWITAPGQATGSVVRNTQRIKYSQGPAKLTLPFTRITCQWNELYAWRFGLSAWRSRNWSPTTIPWPGALIQISRQTMLSLSALAPVTKQHSLRNEMT